MKLLAFLWLLASGLFIALGISLIVLSSIAFTASTFNVIRLVVGSLWTAGGAVTSVLAVRLVVLERMKSKLGKRKNKIAR